MIHPMPPWRVHTLKNYRVYLLESPHFSVTVKSPSNTGLETNVKSLPALCRGAAYVTHDYGSETFYPGEWPKDLWDCDYNIGISNDGRYCCVVSISEENLNLEFAIGGSRDFKVGQTVLLLDGQIEVDGIVYSGVRQFDLTENKTFITEHAALAWTVI